MPVTKAETHGDKVWSARMGNEDVGDAVAVQIRRDILAELPRGDVLDRLEVLVRRSLERAVSVALDKANIEAARSGLQLAAWYPTGAIRASVPSAC